MVAALFLVQRLERGALLEEDVTLDPPRRGLSELVLGELAGGHGEDVVEFLEGLLLRLCDGTDMCVSDKIGTTITGKGVNKPGTQKKIMTKATALRPA